MIKPKMRYSPVTVFAGQSIGAAWICYRPGGGAVVASTATMAYTEWMRIYGSRYSPPTHGRFGCDGKYRFPPEQDVHGDAVRGQVACEGTGIESLPYGHHPV